MGKTKTKIMDDSQPTEEVKKPIRKLGRQDDLVERLKAELEAEPTQEAGEATTETPQTKKAEEQPTEILKKKAKKMGKAKPRSKKYQEAIKDLDKSRSYPLTEAVELTKKLSYSKFTGTLEAHINTVQVVRGLVSLPYASGKTEYKTEAKAPVIHLSLGKLNQPTEQLSANITTLLQTLGKTRVKKVSLSPTMGPSVKLDLSSL